MRYWPSRLLSSTSFSNFSRPALKDLTLVGVGCFGGVLGGYLVLGEDVFWAYVFDGELLTLDFACEGGWTVGIHLGQLLGVRIRRLELPPTFSHSQPLGPRLFRSKRRGRRGGLYPLVKARLRGPPFQCLIQQVGGYRIFGRAFSGPSSLGRLRRGDQSRHSASRRVSFLKR